jgi:hypothetical protein
MKNKKWKQTKKERKKKRKYKKTYIEEAYMEPE